MRWSIKTKLTAGFGLLLGLFVVFGALVLKNITTVQRQFSQVIESDTHTIAQANRLYRFVVDMESGQRGFCITQREDLLEPYCQACTEFVELLERLQVLAQDQPTQLRTLERIDSLVRQWQSQVAEPEIAMAKQAVATREMDGHIEDLRDQAALLETDVGKALLGQIRAEFSHFIRAVEAAANQRYAAASKTTRYTKRITVWVILFSVAFGATVASMSIYMITSAINRLLKGTEIIGNGDIHHRITVYNQDEIGQLGHAFNRMMDRIENETVQREKAQHELVETNQHLEEQTRLASDMVVQAERANKTKSQFLANMSHEIRTPIHSIMGFSDLLAEGDFTKEQQEDIAIIRESAANLLMLIDEILDFSKIEAGHLQADMIDFTLDRILDTVESMVKPLTQNKPIEFKIIAAPNLPAHIHSDPFRLQQCLVNLVNNAIKFTHQGHVHVKITTYDDQSQQFLKIDVEDTGIGIPQDRQQAIFESFTQADGSTTRKYGGTGLGLTITRQLTELLGGQLTLSSEPGKGSVFSLVIPTGVGGRVHPCS